MYDCEFGFSYEDGDADLYDDINPYDDPDTRQY